MPEAYVMPMLCDIMAACGYYRSHVACELNIIACSVMATHCKLQGVSSWLHSMRSCIGSCILASGILPDCQSFPVISITYTHYPTSIMVYICGPYPYCHTDKRIYFDTPAHILPIHSNVCFQTCGILQHYFSKWTFCLWFDISVELAPSLY
jgi:hypothetical protein